MKGSNLKSSFIIHHHDVMCSASSHKSLGGSGGRAAGRAGGVQRVCFIQKPSSFGKGFKVLLNSHEEDS
jgi:hypothetical protein